MFKVLTKGCEPTKGSKYSACIDLYSAEDVIIGAGETVKVPLGVCIDLNYFFTHEKIKILNKDFFMERHYLQLELRSSLRAKGIQAGTGIIDLDYKDEIMIILHNPLMPKIKDKEFQFVELISKGDKIAQIMLCEHKSYLFGIETEDERTGGFGSTGNQ